MRANSLGETGSRFHNVSLQQMHAGNDHSGVQMPYLIDQIRNHLPLQAHVEGAEPIREVASQTGIIPLRQTCTYIYIYARTHAHTHRGWTQGWADHPFKKSFGWHPYKEILGLVTWGEECAARVMWPVWGNEWISLFKALVVCCATCLPALNYAVHHHLPRDPIPKKRQFFLFAFVLINPYLQLILKLNGKHESSMYYNVLFLHPFCCSLINTQHFIGLALSSD